MEARLARLEEAFGRVELLLTRLEERAAGLATRAELIEATGRLETELARKPGTAGVWGIGATLVVGGFGLILATLGVVAAVLGLHH